MTFAADPTEYLPAGYERVALQVAYNGRHYHGWQCQKGAVSVQEKLESALTQVADTPIKVVCAGRTDAGVHASGQVVHFDTPNTRPCGRGPMVATQIYPMISLFNGLKWYQKPSMPAFLPLPVNIAM